MEKERDHEKIKAEQQMRNHLRNGQRTKAALIAVSLNEPFQLRKILESPGVKDQDYRDIVRTICESSEENTAMFLKYISAWNNRSRTSPLAQRCIQHLLKIKSAKAFAAVKDEGLLDALLAYTERHANRMDKLIQSSFILETMMDL